MVPDANRLRLASRATGMLVALVFAAAGAAGAAAAERAAAQPFDFDGDGYADLTVGIPLEDIGSRREAGAVQILYGSRSGPTARDQLWHQGSRGIKGAPEDGDMFGEVLASADFDADGYADLAVGIPHEDVADAPGAGAVHILRGSADGLTARDRIWHQGSRGVPGAGEPGDHFGASLATGDLDGDGYPDLAIGVPDEGLGGRAHVGRVVILRGSARGLQGSGATSLHGGQDPLIGDTRSEERFGQQLAAGDVTGDGRDDVVIAMPGGADGRPGVVHLVPGSPTWPDTAGRQVVSLAALGLGDDRITAVAVGDVTSDGRDDVAVSASGGRVVLLHGFPDGLHPSSVVGPSSAGAEASWEVAHPGALAIADVTGDGAADVAVNAGTSLEVIPGDGRDLGATVLRWPFEGSLLGALPLSGGSHAWMVIGRGWTTIGRAVRAGAVVAYRGTPTGSGGTSSLWHQDTPGIKGAAELDDRFGQAPR